MDANHDATELLLLARDGDSQAARQLVPAVYAELRAMADRFFRGQSPDHTLQPTALAHEAYLKLIDQTRVGPGDDAHFLAASAHAMRSILVDHARRRATDKRGGGRRPMPLDEAVAVIENRSSDILELNECLDDLAQIDEVMARVVELRFFGGMTMPEIARTQSVSVPTVERKWRSARAWLYRRLKEPEGSDDDAH